MSGGMRAAYSGNRYKLGNPRHQRIHEDDNNLRVSSLAVPIAVIERGVYRS